MTAKEFIEKMQDISEKSGISLDDMYVKACIPTNVEWNEWKKKKHNNFIICAHPFTAVDTMMVQNPDIPFILELDLVWHWLSDDEEVRERYSENYDKYFAFFGKEASSWWDINR